MTPVAKAAAPFSKKARRDEGLSGGGGGGEKKKKKKELCVRFFGKGD